MIQNVVAEPEQQYRSWLAAQAEPSRPPAAPAALKGREIFMRAACSLCHTIRGTPARASIGPDLTHVASRRTIAGGTLVNNRANMQAWVTHAQSLKPGSLMPDLTAFTGEELNALVAYLETLE
jgi:cytochrome c oxidase subunit 2